VIVGGGGTLKTPTLVPFPAGVVTLIGPLVVPGATTAVILVGELTLNLDAAVPLNATAVAPVKPEPLIVTLVPGGPPVGVNDEIAGPDGPPPDTVKLPALVAEPEPVVTMIWPLVAPAGTVATSRESRTTVKVAGVPLNVTEVAPAR
jgi:hypothetical protein